jgi:hypothetical protein
MQVQVLFDYTLHTGDLKYHTAVPDGNFKQCLVFFEQKRTYIKPNTKPYGTIAGRSIGMLPLELLSKTQKIAMLKMRLRRENRKHNLKRR